MIADQRVPAEEVLILVRSDHHGLFTAPIKDELRRREIPFSDPSEIKVILADPLNRKVLNLLRLRVNCEDSLSWASMLYLTPGFGPTFFDYVYDHARDARTPFGQALLSAYHDGFSGLSAALKGRASSLTADTLGRIETIELPTVQPENGWGHWITEIFRRTIGCEDIRHDG